MKKKRNFSLFFFTFLMVSISACKNDNEEDLAPQPPTTNTCNTETVTFTNTIQPILVTNCTSCHSTGFNSGGVILDNHAGAKIPAQNGKLVGVVSHAPGFKQMPQGGNKIATCDIEKIKKWVADGAPNN